MCEKKEREEGSLTARYRVTRAQMNKIFENRVAGNELDYLLIYAKSCLRGCMNNSSWFPGCWHEYHIKRNFQVGVQRCVKLFQHANQPLSQRLADIIAIW